MAFSVAEFKSRGTLGSRRRYAVAAVWRSGTSR